MIMGHGHVQPLFCFIRASFLLLVLAGLLFFSGLGMGQAYASESSLSVSILNQTAGDTTPATQGAPQKCDLVRGQTPKGLNGNVRIRYDTKPPIGLGYVNNGGPCVWKVFLVSYRMVSMDSTYGQTKYDSTGVTVYPGQRLTLQVNVPPECRVQLDLVADQVLELKNVRTSIYHDTGRFIAANYDGGSHLCAASTDSGPTTATAATNAPTTAPATTAATTGPVSATPASTTAVPTTVVPVTSVPATTAASGGYTPVGAATPGGSGGTVADTTRVPATATTTTPTAVTTTTSSVTTTTSTGATTATSAPVSSGPASTTPATVEGTVLGVSRPTEVSGSGADTGQAATAPAVRVPSALPNTGAGGGVSTQLWWTISGIALALLGLATTCGLYLLRRRKA